MRIAFGLLCALAGLLVGCERVDRGVDTTSENDFTLSLEVLDRSVQVGDQTPLVLRLRRTDHSNLQPGMRGRIVLTASVHGSVSPVTVPIEVADDVTEAFVENLVFTARSPGIAEVRASFLDATVLVKILISSVTEI